jgi:hypothetical protein
MRFDRHEFPIMDTERYTYLCCLIIDCAAYRIGGPAILERIVEQNLPALQQHYPEQAWTPDRVRRLFESNGLLDAIAPRLARSDRPDDVRDLRSGQETGHADQIRMLLARIDNIRKKLRSDSEHCTARVA